MHRQYLPSFLLGLFCEWAIHCFTRFTTAPRSSFLAFADDCASQAMDFFAGMASMGRGLSVAFGFGVTWSRQIVWRSVDYIQSNSSLKQGLCTGQHLAYMPDTRRVGSFLLDPEIEVPFPISSVRMPIAVCMSRTLVLQFPSTLLPIHPSPSPEKKLPPGFLSC